MTSASGEPHFSSDARGVPKGPGRFVTVSDIDAVEFVPGLQFRPVLGERAMANFVSFAPHTVAPTHVHEEESSSSNSTGSSGPCVPGMWR
jgi:hypothetical protein